jgi:hypothetical protein
MPENMLTILHVAACTLRERKYPTLFRPSLDVLEIKVGVFDGKAYADSLNATQFAAIAP